MQGELGAYEKKEASEMSDFRKVISAFPKVYCPLCRRVATSTVETIPGTANLMTTQHGMEHTGETNVEWNSQRTDKDDRGLTLFWCEPCGSEFAVNLADRG